MTATTAASSTTLSSFALARQMNGERGRHIKSNTFSVKLSGRFYKNNSMEAQRNRDNKLVELREKRRNLILYVQREKEKIDELDEQLRINEARRLHALKQQRIAERGVLILQSHLRRKTSTNIVRILHREHLASNYIAYFFQRYYRGYCGRLLRDSIIELHRKQGQRRLRSSIHIQSMVRNAMAKSVLSSLRHKRRIEQDKAATLIQSSYRLSRDKCVYNKQIALKRLKEHQENASVAIQSTYRGMKVRLANKRALRIEEKPPPRRRLRRNSIQSARKTFVVQSVPRIATTCWDLVQTSIRGDKTRQTISHSQNSSNSHRITMQRRENRVESILPRRNNNQDELSTEKEEAMARLTTASEAALKRHEMEKRAEAARLRVVEYRKAQRKQSNDKRKRAHLRKRYNDNDSRASDLKTDIASSCPDDTMSMVSICSSSICTTEDIPGQDDHPLSAPTEDQQLKENNKSLQHQAFTIDSTIFDEGGGFEEEFEENEHDLE